MLWITVGSCPTAALTHHLFGVGVEGGSWPCGALIPPRSIDSPAPIPGLMSTGLISAPRAQGPALGARVIKAPPVQGDTEGVGGSQHWEGGSQTLPRSWALALSQSMRIPLPDVSLRGSGGRSALIPSGDSFLG